MGIQKQKPAALSFLGPSGPASIPHILNIMRLTPNKYRFPWREGQRFRLLLDGEQFFTAMLEAIEGARNYVLLEMYLIQSGAVVDRFSAALTQACERGVATYILLDDFGARGLGKTDRHRLTLGGAHILYYNPLRYGKLRRNLFRDHRKLLVVDAHTAFVGGVGMTDDFDRGGDPTHYWRETVIQISGPNVEDWKTLFLDTWNRCADQPLSLPVLPHNVAKGGQLGRVTLTQGPRHLEIKRSVIKHIRSAEHRIWFATAYFVPSWKIRRALRRAARRDVDVRLLLPGAHTDHPAIRHAGRRFYYGLLRHGVRIFEYQPRFSHSKAMLCDDWVSIGSSNIDRWNFTWNLEANQEVEDPDFAHQVRTMFDTDLAQSQECLLAQWRTRPWYSRVLEWFWGSVDIWLMGLSRRLHNRFPGGGKRK